MLEMRRSQLESLPILAEGGEATIYEYGPKKVIKVYKNNVDISKKEMKVKKFLQARFPNNVVAPEDIVIVNGKFDGYVMDRLNGAEDFHKFTKPKFLTTSGFNNKDIVEMIASASATIKNLHENGVIIGDISDYNIVAVGKKPYFIDVDSWGAKGMFYPDAYTELFTCPDSYTSNGRIEFSIENEEYNFAVLAFNMLSRIHPFFGVYTKKPNMTPVQRMKERISILGREKDNITIPKIIPSWKWMSPKLEQTFIDIFENGKRVDITGELQELAGNMKYCDKHNIYYYGKYKECPICNSSAQIAVAPTIVVTKAPTSGGPRISVYFTARDCKFILGTNQYLSTTGEVVYFNVEKPTLKRKMQFISSKRIDYSVDGEYVFVADDNKIDIIDKTGKTISSIDRYYKSYYTIRGNDLYYVDKGSHVIKLAITSKGNVSYSYGKQFNPLFEAAKSGEVFIASMYPKKAIINANDYNFEVNYDGKINEYAIKFDPVSKRWLFVYLKPDGKYRTIIFGKNKVEYDDDVINYNATPLSGICFYSNIIYDPADSKFIGINPYTNNAKEFVCDVVQESSKLEFIGTGFRIYNDDKIYNFN